MIRHAPFRVRPACSLAQRGEPALGHDEPALETPGLGIQRGDAAGHGLGAMDQRRGKLGGDNRRGQRQRHAHPGNGTPEAEALPPSRPRLCALVAGLRPRRALSARINPFALFSCHVGRLMR